jgi:hypothetical protein
MPASRPADVRGSNVLRHVGRNRRGGVTQTKLPPAIPGRGSEHEQAKCLELIKRRQRHCRYSRKTVDHRSSEAAAPVFRDALILADVPLWRRFCVQENLASISPGNIAVSMHVHRDPL